MALAASEKTTVWLGSSTWLVSSVAKPSMNARAVTVCDLYRKEWPTMPAATTIISSRSKGSESTMRAACKWYIAKVVK